jgi:hypothetical protein
MHIQRVLNFGAQGTLSFKLAVLFAHMILANVGPCGSITTYLPQTSEQIAPRAD